MGENNKKINSPCIFDLPLDLSPVISWLLLSLLLIMNFINYVSDLLERSYQ